MFQVEFRFYGSLNDFLLSGQRGKALTFSFLDRNSVKDAIESLGVPHPEVEFILVDGVPKTFTYILEDGNRTGVYPHFFQMDLPQEMRVHPPWPQEIRFVLDVHLGKLAAYLRMLGFDTLYQNNYDDPTLAQISAEEQRILLTRDIGLLKRNQVVFGYFLRKTNPFLQLQEICDRFSLSDKIQPLTRCMECNTLLEPVAKEAVADQLPDKVKQAFQTFFLCKKCHKVYWPGTHCNRMESIIASLN